MDENIFDRINEVDLKKTMEDSYIDYAMSVIASRAREFDNLIRYEVHQSQIWLIFFVKS